MHFSQTTSFSRILRRVVKSTARVQLGLNHDYKPETLQQKHLQYILSDFFWSRPKKVKVHLKYPKMGNFQRKLFLMIECQCK